MNEETEVRRAVAADHGLDWRAAALLVGETVEQLHESAAALAELLGKEREPEREPSFLERARAAKVERKRELAMILTGRRGRDELGRFASSGFGRWSEAAGAVQAAPGGRAQHDADRLDALLRGGWRQRGRRTLLAAPRHLRSPTY